MKYFLTFTFCLFIRISFSQNFYFPPTSGNTWDTLSPNRLGWCSNKIDSFYTFLEAKNTKGFILLKGGKIVLEKYFGTFSKDSFHIWNSAAKSFTGILTGIAQQNALLNINDSATKYLGTGWTSCTPTQENKITIKHLLTMTSGLDPAVAMPCNNEDDSKACLQYSTTPGTKWAYHTGAYRKIEDIIAAASGLTYNAFTKNNLGSKIGMGGIWINSLYVSKVRDAARFGLLGLNKGVWVSDSVLKDRNYFNNSVNTSQNLNLGYGYLWWLNGKSSYIAPGIPTVFNKSIIASGPNDMYMALGKDDQKIYISPSKEFVIVRFGGSAYGLALAFSPFDAELWTKINNLNCNNSSIETKIIRTHNFIYPNPASTFIKINPPNTGDFSLSIFNALGQEIITTKNTFHVNITDFKNGIYNVILTQNEQIYSMKTVIEK